MPGVSGCRCSLGLLLRSLFEAAIGANATDFGWWWCSTRVARVGCTVALGAVCVCSRFERQRVRVASGRAFSEAAAGATQLAQCAVSARSDLSSAGLTVAVSVFNRCLHSVAISG